VAIASAALAYLLSALLTPVYESKATFFLATNASAPSYVRSDSATPEPLFPTPDEKTAALNVGILRGREMFTALSQATGESIDDLQKRVDITVSGEFMVDVFARNPDAQAAARAANLVPTLYRQFHEDILRGKARDEANVLRAQSQSLRDQLTELRAQSSDLTARFGAGLTDATIDRLAADQRAAAQTLQGAQEEIRSVNARLGALEATLDTERGAFERDETALSTPLLDVMVEQLLALRIDIASVTGGPNSPRRKAIQTQMEEMEKAIADEKLRLANATTKPTGSLHEQLRVQRAVKQADLRGLQALIPDHEARLAQAKADLAKALQHLDAETTRRALMARLASQLETVETNLAAAQLQAQNATAPLVVVETAFPTTRPAFPLPILNTIVAAITGIVLGLYAALFIGHSDRVRAARRQANLEMPFFTRDEISRLRELRRSIKEL
jgi:uncharacterized protein involved in exopolysaccharide biosynthesis